MKKYLLKNYKILFVTVLLLLFSLSCDDQLATAIDAPDLDFALTVTSEVKNCSYVGCISACTGEEGCSSYTSPSECSNSESYNCEWSEPSNEVYNANVSSSGDTDYHLYFQITLKDIENVAVNEASITTSVDWAYSSDDNGPCNANFVKLNDTTNDAGRLEGYWADEGQTGDFILTTKYTYTDEAEISYSVSIEYPVTVRSISDVVTQVTLLPDNFELVVQENTVYNTLKAKALNSDDAQLENVLIYFELIDSEGSLNSAESLTECTLVTVSTDEGDIEVCDNFATVTYSVDGLEFDQPVNVRASVETATETITDDAVFYLVSEATAPEGNVTSMETDFSPSPLIIPINDANQDSVYTLLLTATLKDLNGGVVQDATVNFEYANVTDGESPIGVLQDVVIESNENGKAIATILVEENEVDFKETIDVRAYITNPYNPIDLLFDTTTSIDLYTDEYYDLENSVLQVAYLLNNITPNPLILLTEDDIVDSTYTIEVSAIVKNESGLSIEGVPVNFVSDNPLIGALVATNPVSDSTGTARATIQIQENEVETKESIAITAFTTHPETGAILNTETNTVDIYTDTYYDIESAQELNVWHDADEEINDNSTITYITDLYAEVLNQHGAKMPNMPVLFSKLTTGIGSLDNSTAYTDSSGNAASVQFTLNPNTLDDFPDNSTVQVTFNVALFGDSEESSLNETFTITYQLNGNSEPEYNVSDFNFYPNVSAISHNLYNDTEISVIAKNQAGVGISNVLVRFELDESTRTSNGELDFGEVYTCCQPDSSGVDTTNGQNGVAKVTYTNIQGGSDILTAYILDPETAEILADSNGNPIGLDSIQIYVNDTCPDCFEELILLSEFYELPATEADIEQTNIYAFYTDSLGSPAEINSFINLQSLQPDENGDLVNVGSVSPGNAFFVNGTVSDLSSGIIPNAPPDSSIVYASATFNMENASGLVKIVGSYLGLTDTLGVQINSTGASFVEIIPPYPSTIAVQGSPDQESTIITAEIRDGNGNLVSDSYITRYSLAAPAIIAGVHFNGEVGVTDTYTLSSNGEASITLNSGQIPVSVAMTVKIYQIAEISSVNDLDALPIIAEASAVPVTVASGPPSSGVIGYSFLEALNIGGGLTEMPVSIMLWDAWSNPVADSISVYFTLNPVTAGSIIPEAKTANLKPNGTDEDTWPGVAWTTIQYNASQLFEFPEILATTTGNMCYDINAAEFDPTVSYDLCVEPNYSWQTEVMLTYSSFDNIVSYQNVCVDCTLELVPLSDTNMDFQCDNGFIPAEFPVTFRAQLLDFYGVPVEGAIVELLIFGSQGQPTIEAFEYLCYWDSNNNGQVDNGEEQFNDDSEPLNQTECDAISVFTWGPGPMIPEPPSTNVLTDQYGLKYWQVTFNSDECTLTAQDPDSYTCTSPTVEANLVNPNGASSEEVSITINSTCVE